MRMSQFLTTLGCSMLQQHCSSAWRLQLRATLSNRAAINTDKVVKECRNEEGGEGREHFILHMENQGTKMRLPQNLILEWNSHIS